MSSTVAALPPPIHHFPQKPEYDDGIDVPEYAFSELWQDKKEGIALGDVLDIIYPLQHIPIVSSIYRMTTEDDIGVGLRLLGGALFRGPLGILVSGLTAIFEDNSGGSVEQHAAAPWNTLTDKNQAKSQIAAAGQKGPASAAPPYRRWFCGDRQPVGPAAAKQSQRPILPR